MRDSTLAILRKIKYKGIFIRLIKRELCNSKNRIDEFPHTIQMPITYKCNFNCVMCGMHHMVSRSDFTIEEIRKILSDKLFSKVIGIGVNGGEPFLRKDLPVCVRIMLETIPTLKSLFFISNGYFPEKIIQQLIEIRSLMEGRDCKINLSLSVDGINDMQDFHRGAKNSFQKINKTIELIKKRNGLVDTLNIICTITKYNIERIIEVEKWAEEQQLEVAYNIATENVRIENEDKLSDFSIMNDDKARHMAMEFFYKKYNQTENERYFGLFLFLRDGKRYADCPCMHNEWITVTPDSQIGFCATHSKNLGSGIECSPYELVSDNFSYLKELKRTYCNTCSHYMYRLNRQGLLELYKEKMRRTV